MTNRWVISSVFFFILTANAFASDFPLTGMKLKKIGWYHTSPETLISLDSHLILPASIILFCDSVRLESGNDFNFFENVVLVKNGYINNKKTPAVITIFYKELPFSFQSLYRRRETRISFDSTSRKENYFTSSLYSPEIFFGDGLTKSGSIYRGFNIGSNRDLSLNSGFRLQFSGRLAQDVDIVAALTDENSPLQPEGNTQTLQEIDNVFIEVRGTNFETTIGDFYLKQEDGEFPGFQRKLQGVKGSYRQAFSSSSSASVLMAGASSRGKYNSLSFSGIEGVQGPYRLYGKNNERDIIIIAGTERVYVDGELMVRGESNDYSIDYGIGEIIFSPRRLITSASRLVVDFEYSDRSYTRNFASAHAAASFFNDNLKVSTSLIQESDDPDSPIDLLLSDADKALLRNASSDVVFKKGESFVGIDPLTGNGKGNYASIDTLIGNDSLKIFIYEPYSPRAFYAVSFSPVGRGKGDYVRVSIGQYRFTGKKNGEYMPAVLLPPAQKNQLAGIRVISKPVNSLTISTETAFTMFDANRLSELPVTKNSGTAFKYLIDLAPADITVGKTNIGNFRIGFSQRHISENFIPLDRIDDVEFARHWSYDSTVVIPKTSEDILEGTVSYKPLPALEVSGSYGKNKRGEALSADRLSGNFIYDVPKQFHGSYSIEQIGNSDNSLAQRSNWLRHSGDFSAVSGIFEPALAVRFEQRSLTASEGDSLRYGSFQFISVNPRLVLSEIWGFKIRSAFEWRPEKAVTQGQFADQSNTTMQSVEIQYSSSALFSSEISIINRMKKFQGFFRQTNPDIATLLLRSHSRYSPFSRGLDGDLIYEVSAQRSAKMQRVFYQVKKGEGQYIWTDGNGNGVIDYTDENDFRIVRYDGDYIIITVPTDQLFPVVDLKSSFRIRVTPSRWLGESESFLQYVSSETFFRIEERSSDPVTAHIYFLDLSKFFNPQLTLSARQTIQEDIFLFENWNSLSLRFRFLQRTSLGQYNTGAEYGFFRERSIRIRFRVSDEIANQSEYFNYQDDIAAPFENIRVREITSNSIVTDWSYRPEQNFEIGFKFDVSRAVNVNQKLLPSADINSQTLRFVLSSQGSGQGRAEFSREEAIVTSTSSAENIPYELTGGRAPGKTFLWNFSFEYKIGNNLQSTLQYSGRVENENFPVHSGKAEIRAYF